MLSYFNSSMVRLKGYSDGDTVKIDTTFQFQYGAIKRKIQALQLPVLDIFQFQYAAIKRILGAEA